MRDIETWANADLAGLKIKIWYGGTELVIPARKLEWSGVWNSLQDNQHC